MHYFFTDLISIPVPLQRLSSELSNSLNSKLKAQFISSRSFFICFLATLSFIIGIHNQAISQGVGLPTGFTDQLVNGGWNAAVGFTFSPDGKRMYVWEKGGKVWIVENGVKLSAPLIDISDEVGNWKDHGLLGFALHPDFESNGYYYLLYVVDRHHLINAGTVNYDPTVNEYSRATIGRLTRYKARALDSFKTTDLSSRTILMGATASTGLPILQVTHGVGSLVFGTDHTLLISTGDGSSPLSGSPDVGSAGESYFLDGLADGIITQNENVGAFRSQLLNSLSGKVLRIDPETGNGIPSNPFYDQANPGSPISKVWALGLRNPSRITLKPGTGSHNAADGDPGILYIGDVGWDTWEEVDVVTGPGLNFGWPIYEGYELSLYATKTTQNKYVPNPLFGTSGCTQQYFRFIDLLKQTTADGQVSFPIPCNSALQIPDSLPHFVHTRPIMDWKHGTGPSRTGTFTGNDATVANLGSEGSVPGPQFGGSSSIGGVWYTGDKFPVEYRNVYFTGDYGARWIRSLSFDANHKLQKVDNFINDNATVVYMNTHPTDGALYYINYATQIRRVSYVPSGNQPPVAVASINQYYGSSPLTVQLTGSGSTDPEGLPLTYEWDFGDNSPTSNLPNPSKVFSAPAGVPTKYNITLKVTDSEGLISETTLFVSVNNTPPVVNITSPINNSKYTMTQETVANLTANVTDAEHISTALTYQWQTVLHHNTHTHPDPYDNNPSTTASITPIGCDGNIYFYVVTLIVTDAAGLSDTASVRIDPDCESLPANINTLTATAGDGSVNLSWVNPTNTFDELILVAKENLSITADPTGNGSAYAADLNYTGTGTEFDGGKVVYKGNLSPQIIIGLTNNIKYYFKVFTRKGSIWSSGVEANTIPRSANNQAPTITLVSPVNNTSVTQGADVSIQVNASDTDGNISKVEFYAGSIKLAEDLTEPYSFTWKNVPAGNYSITAKAFDNLDATSISNSRNILINSISNTSFYRAINLNGAALTIDNNLWDASTAGNYTLQGAGLGTTSKPTSKPVPITDVNRASMITDAVSAKPLSITIGALPTGSYDVYLYVWEDNRAINVNFSVEGSQVLTYNTGYEGYWERLGPWRANITDGTIDIGINAGNDYPLISGIEIWKVNTGSSNTPPVVSLTSPASGTSYTAPASISLSATASDADGTVSKVEFYEGANKIGEDLDSPYSFTWNNVAAGTYQLTAKATDNTGAVTNSTIVSVIVNTTPNQSPVVSLISPASGTSYTAPASISLSATASDADGTVSKVEFYEGANKIGEDLDSPYSFTWNNVAAGTYQLTAKAIDNTGAINTSTVTTVSVTTSSSGVSFYRAINLNGGALSIDNRNFEASSSAANFSFTGRTFANQGIALVPATDASRATMIRSSIYSLASVPASLALGGVTNGSYDVYLYVWEDSAPEPYNLTLEGQAIVSSYTTGGKGSWAKLGPYRTLIADGIININASGGAANLSGLEIWQVNPNTPPVVSLTSPASGTSYTAPASISLSATASDADGTVSKVEFYEGANKIGEDLDSPYSFTWNNVAAGTYQLTAKAIDNGTATTTSTISTISVSAPNQSPVVSLISPASGTSYTAPASISLSATASDADGTVSKVEFYEGANKIGEDLDSPYSFTWNNVAAGTYQLTAKAIDNTGAINTSTVTTVSVTTSSSGVSFYRAINLNGGALSIDNRNFEASSSAANFSFTGRTFANQGIALVPATDASRATMIRSSIYSLASVPASLALGGVTNGSYDVYLYVWEDSAPEPYNLTLEGQAIVSSYTTGGKGSWAKLGPYRTLIADGIININASGGAANLSGLEIWQVNPNTPPVVSLTSPASGTSYTAPASISLSATASDADGTVSKVEFYEGANKIGEDLDSPYSFTWNNVAAGTYQLTAKAIDNGTATTTSTISTISVNDPPCTASGTILRELWTGITGTAVTAIPVNTTPQAVSQLTIFETPSNAADAYGQRIRGYICAPLSGNYTFWIAADNNAELWLSTDDNPANKVKIAHITGETSGAGIRAWTKYPSQQSVPQTLVAGKRYYIEALHKENASFDNFAVGWQLPNGSYERPIQGKRLSPFVPSGNRVGEEQPEIEDITVDLRAYPVPTSKDISLEFSFLEEQQVSLQIYDTRGNLITILHNDTVEAGKVYTYVYNVSHLPNGIYLARLAGKRTLKHKKIMVEKQ